MRTRYCFALLAAGTFTASSAFGMTESPKPEPPPRETSSASPAQQASSNATGPRAEAERSYALAYEEIAKAKQDIADGKAKNAEKKFRRALERMTNAVKLDTTYFEAWNLIGYASRKVGDYEQAFAAYEKSLSISPGYAPAREYLGEAMLEKNDLAGARLQLALLERRSPDSTEAKTLKTAVDSYLAAHPEVAKVAPAAASTDSTTAKGETK